MGRHVARMDDVRNAYNILGCYSGFRRRVDQSVEANVLKKHTVFIFRAEILVGKIKG
jgi:hypothetical protein